MLFYSTKQPIKAITEVQIEDLSYLNRLRTLAALAVVLLHATLGMIPGMTPKTVDWWLAQVICLACQWSVPVFVMISGALLLDPRKQETSLVFYRKRLARIAIPTLFWTSLYFVLRRTCDHEPVNLFYIFDHLLAADPPYHTYFLFLIAGLYALTPVLRPYVRQAPAAERRRLVVILLILTTGYSLGNALFWHNQRYLLTFFLPYLGYYLAGYELRCLDLKPLRPHVIAIALGLSIIYIALLGPTYLAYDGRLHGRFVLGFFSLPVMLLSLAIFALARYRQEHHPRRPNWIGRLCEKIAPQTFGIYLIHVGLLIGLREIAGDEGNDLHFLPVVVVVSLLVFVLSWGLTWLLQKIPLLQRVV